MNTNIKYEIVKVKVSDIKTDPANPNVLSKETEKSLSNSIDRFGYVQPIIVDKETMVIADGEHRLKTLKDKGVTEVEVYLYPFKDDVERRLFRQVSNKLHGAHDYELDLEEYRVILEEQGNLDSLKEYVAMEQEDIARILEELGVKEKEEEPEKEESRPQNKAILKFRTREELESAIDHLEAIKVKFNAKLDIRI